MRNLNESLKKLLMEYTSEGTLLDQLISSNDAAFEELVTLVLKNAIDFDSLGFSASMKTENYPYPVIYLKSTRKRNIKYAIFAVDEYIDIVYVDGNDWQNIDSIEIKKALNMPISSLSKWIEAALQPN
jgi:hypothetical protein